MSSRIFYTKPSITELEISYAKDAAEYGWGDKCYEYIERFEESFKNHLGSKYSISTSSCTGAIHMGLHALGIKSGDEVILADTNWILKEVSAAIVVDFSEPKKYQSWFQPQHSFFAGERKRKR